MQNRIKKYVSVLLAVVLMSVCLSGVLMAQAEDLVAINQNNFPDAGWRSIVSTYYDKDGDGYLSQAERNITVMSIPGQVEAVLGQDATVESIQGVEFFTSLKVLRCAGIGLLSLDVSKLTALEDLSCQGNQLNDLNVRTNVNLVSLNCSDNNLNSLSLSYNVSMEKLMCSENSITALNTSSLAKLNYFKCSNNQLSALDVSTNTLLQTLICSGNHIASMDLSKNTALVGATASTLGDQTITAPASQNNNTFFVDVALDGTKIDYQQTDKYENSKFVTTNYSLIKSGFVYEYNPSNEQAEPFDVTVSPTKNFYVVSFYTDENKTTLIGTSSVDENQTATAVTIKDMPQCKTLDRWSDSLENITSDKDVYAIYKDAHNFAVSAFTPDGVATISCPGCGSSRTVNYKDCLNSKTGDANFEALMDANNDGYINIKDFRIFYNKFCA